MQAIKVDIDEDLAVSISALKLANILMQHPDRDQMVKIIIRDDQKVVPANAVVLDPKSIGDLSFAEALEVLFLSPTKENLELVSSHITLPMSKQ